MTLLTFSSHMDREANSSGLGKLVMFLEERIQVVELILLFSSFLWEECVSLDYILN